MAPNDGFAKVHYGFILKAQNKIAESIPYLKVTVPALALFPFSSGDGPPEMCVVSVTEELKF